MDVDSFEHADSLSKEEIDKRVEKSRNILVQAGAHYVINEISELPAVCADINQRLARGESPY